MPGIFMKIFKIISKKRFSYQLSITVPQINKLKFVGPKKILSSKMVIWFFNGKFFKIYHDLDFEEKVNY